MDFGYSLGVLHHIPDTCAGIKACARLLKRGGPFLVYLYYAFDNRAIAFLLSDGIHHVVFITIGGLKLRSKDRRSLEIRELIGIPREDLVI